MCVVTFRWYILNGARASWDSTSAHWPPAKKRRATICGSYLLFTRLIHTYASEYLIRPNAFVPLLRVINSGPLGDAPSVRDDILADCGLFSERTLSPHCICNIVIHNTRTTRLHAENLYADINTHARKLTQTRNFSVFNILIRRMFEANKLVENKRQMIIECS